MVSIKKATRNAMLFAEETLGAERTRGVRLEEIESASVNGEDAWLITLSMFSAQTQDLFHGGSSLEDAIGLGKRDYKTFTVIKRDGEVSAMKIRELADT
jgi:hypothetical protein